jgi:tRNA pseudouridine38-40 synthase
MVGRYRLWAKIEYDGTAFNGFQIQKRERTVQGEIERALETVSGSRIRIVGAGRTDQGVQAQGQVIGFEVEWRHQLSDLQRALNAVLTSDVVILEMGTAAEGFHPRFSALSRAYRYTLLNSSRRSPLNRHIAWHIEQQLDIAQMTEASHFLVGAHDFSSFGRPPQGENTVREVFRADWQKRGPFLTFDIEANAFLYRMVRSIVGTMVQVGQGQVSVGAFKSILESRDRSKCKYMAPAHGLCLMRVEYPEGVLQ